MVGMGSGQDVDKNEAANVVWGQKVKDLEWFAVDSRLHLTGNRKLGKVLKRMMHPS